MAETNQQVTRGDPARNTRSDPGATSPKRLAEDVNATSEAERAGRRQEGINGQGRVKKAVSREEIAFRGCEHPTVGVEVELPILDAETGELAQGAKRLLQASAEEGITNTAAELMQSMLEIRTGVALQLSDTREELVTTIRRMRNIARSFGQRFAMLGTHPFLRPSASAVFPAERFENAAMKLAWMTYYRVAFGLHIHVGVRSGDNAIAVTNVAMKYLPHLIALSANSPFWQGVDTGLASCRAALYELVPHAGVPPVFGKWKDFRSYYNMMRECRAISSDKDIKWDIRPRPDYGTIEFRICDMPASIERIMALTALTRCLVVSAQRLLESRPKMRHADRRKQWITTENRWLASRYGLKAIYVRTPAGKRRPLGDDLADVMERLIPIAREYGDEKYLKPLMRVDKIESGAERQRRVYRDTGNWKALIEDMVKRLDEELDAGQPRTAPAAKTA